MHINKYALKSCDLSKDLCLYCCAEVLKICDHLLKDLKLTENNVLNLSDHILDHVVELLKLTGNCAVDGSYKICNSALKVSECLCKLLIAEHACLNHLDDLAKKLGDLVECCSDALDEHIVDLGVLKKSLDVNCNEIPNEVTVDCVPLSECGKDYVCVIKNEAYDLLAVVLCDVAENVCYVLAVLCEEVYDLVAVVDEELNNGLGIVVEPIVKCLCCLVAVECNRGNKLFYESIECLGCCLDKVEVVLNNVVDLLDHKCLKLSYEVVYLCNDCRVDLLETCNKLCGVVICDDLKSDYKIVKRLKVKKENLAKIHKCRVGLCIELICNLNKCDKCVDVHHNDSKVCVDKTDKSSVLLVKVLCIKLLLELVYVELELVECIDELLNVTVCLELCVCILVCLVVVLGNNVNNILDSFLLSGVITLVSLDHCCGKSVMTLLRRMSADTVTNYTTCKECKETGKLAVCYSITKNLGHNKKYATGGKSIYIRRIKRSENLNCNIFLSGDAKYIIESRFVNTGSRADSIYCVLCDNVQCIGITHKHSYNFICINSYVNINGHTHRCEHLLCLTFERGLDHRCEELAHLRDHSYLYILCKGKHNRLEGIALHNRRKVENRLYSNRLILASDDCLLKRKIHSDRGCLLGICSRISKLLHIGHSLIRLDLVKSDMNNGSTKKTPNHSGLVRLAYDRVNETITNDIIKTICISIYDTINRCSLCVIELSVLVGLVLSCLHNGRKTCNVCIVRNDNSLKKIAERNTLNVLGNVAEGVHKRNENDLNVRVSKKYRLKSSRIVKSHAHTDEYYSVSHFLESRILVKRTNLLLNCYIELSLVIKDLCLKLGRALANSIL